MLSIYLKLTIEKFSKPWFSGFEKFDIRSVLRAPTQAGIIEF